MPELEALVSLLSMLALVWFGSHLDMLTCFILYSSFYEESLVW